MGLQGAGGIHLGDRTGGDECPCLFILPNVVATGRSVASHDALCVEVLKTSAGLGLSLDGGKSSMAGDGPLVIKRVYKGNALKNPVSSLFSFHLENVLILCDIQGVLCPPCCVLHM